jgi:preprotein translocase subunit SecY
MVSVINLFLAGNVYTQSVFTLTRIWQGKAVVAAVMIPAILAIILRVQQTNPQAEGPIRDWILLIVVGVALQTMKQIEAMIVMRHYEGFMK